MLIYPSPARFHITTCSVFSEVFLEIVSTHSKRGVETQSQPTPVESSEPSPLEGSTFSPSATKKSDLQKEVAQTVTSPQQVHSVSTSESVVPEKPDTRLARMQEQQSELQKKLESQQTLIRGTESNIASTKKEAATGGMTGFFMWSSGTKGAMREDISSMEKVNEARREKATEMAAAIEKQQKAAKDFAQFEQQGRDLQAKGDLAGAQNAFNTAQTIFDASQGTTQPELLLTTASYRESQQRVAQGLNKSVANLDTTETVLRTTQKVAIIAGATVATGGAALAVGGVAGAGAGIGAGIAYGATVGGAAALTEASGHIALGNKTTAQALTDAGNQTLDSTRDAAIASVGTVAGMAVGGYVAAGVAARVGTSVGARVVTAMANGAAAGGTSAAVSTTANTGIEYTAATREFAKQYDSANLSPAEREIAYTKFMQERGLTASGIAQRYAHDVSIGALGGSIGGATGAGRQLATSGRTALAMEGGQGLADLGVGLGDAALRGQLNAEGITSSIAGAITGNVTGRVSHRNHEARQSQQGADPTPPPTTSNDASPPEIFRMEDYRQQQPSTVVQREDLRLAAGAESMSAADSGRPRSEALRAHDERPASIKITRDSETARVEKEAPGMTDGPVEKKSDTSVDAKADGQAEKEPVNASPDATKPHSTVSPEPDIHAQVARERLNQDAVILVPSSRPIPISDPHVAAQKIAEITGGPVPPIGKPFLISPEFIRWTQNSIDHKSRNGQFTVIETADAMAAKGESQLKPNRLPAIMIFVDTEGRIWSRDNRRLASAVLGDSPVNAQIMSASTVEKEALRNYSSQTDGRSVEVFHSVTRERLGQLVNHRLVERQTE